MPNRMNVVSSVILHYLVHASQSYYSPLDIKLDYTNSEHFCIYQCNSHLASVHSYDEFQDLINYMRNETNQASDFWIGLNNISGDGFQWIDNSIFDFGADLSGYLYPWDLSQPDNWMGTEHCTEVFSLNLWNDYNCNKQSIFVCNECTPSYTLIQNRFSWNNANNYCKAHCGSDLVSIHSAIHNEQIINLRDEKIGIAEDIWIGLNSIDTIPPGTFEWSDGSEYDFGKEEETNGYPWAIHEPRRNVDCIQIWGDAGWDDALCIMGDNMFICQHCDGILNKYHISPGTMKSIDAQKYCKDAFDTELVSIHSDRDMEEIKLLCDNRTSAHIEDWGCWIGLNDRDNEGVFVWDDDTTFDYGSIFHVYPWSIYDPNNLSDNSVDEDCVAYNLYHYGLPSNDTVHRWVDIPCSDNNGSYIYHALCNLPSMICRNNSYNDVNWNNIRGDWYWRRNCEIENNDVNVESVMIADKWWINGNGQFVMEYMYKIDTIHNNKGNAGILIFSFESICNYYYIGISPYDQCVFLRKNYNETMLEIAVNASLIYELDRYYNLQIRIINNKHFIISINNIEYINYYDNNQMIAINKIMSGYIGLKNYNTNINIKYLYVSGVAVNINGSNQFISSFDKCPTPTPTEIPTTRPTINKLVHFNESDDNNIIIILKYNGFNNSINNTDDQLINITNILIHNIMNNLNCSEYESKFVSNINNTIIIKAFLAWSCINNTASTSKDKIEDILIAEMDTIINRYPDIILNGDIIISYPNQSPSMTSTVAKDQNLKQRTGDDTLIIIILFVVIGIFIIIIIGLILILKQKQKQQKQHDNKQKIELQEKPNVNENCHNDKDQVSIPKNNDVSTPKNNQDIVMDDSHSTDSIFDINGKPQRTDQTKQESMEDELDGDIEDMFNSPGKHITIEGDGDNMNITADIVTTNGHFDNGDV